ncbi:MAG: hypothetical protein WC697_02930 [Patescibacteria group bacterium]|jgi:hypothetical protein
MKIILKIYTILLIIGVLVFFGWLIYKNLAITGKIFVVNDFCNKSQFIPNLYPEDRVGTLEKENGICFQRIFTEPVYFKVNASRTFSKAKIKIIYENEGKSIIQLGLMKRKITPLDWRYDLQSADNHISKDNIEEQNAEFSVGLDNITDHSLEFIISASGLNEGGQEIKIRRIEVELSRSPENWQAIFTDLKNYLFRKH